MSCCRHQDQTDDEHGDHDVTTTSGLVPTSKRKCRDVLCCLLFLVYWIGMAVVAYLAVKTGLPLSLIYGKDYNGSVCGTTSTDATLGGKVYTTYPRLDQDLLAAEMNGVSVSSMQFFGVCVSECPKAGDTTCTYDNATCWYVAQDTEPTLFRCLPVATQNETVLNETCVDPVGADPACTTALYMQGACSTVCHTKKVQKNVWEVEAASGTTNPITTQLQSNLATLGRFINDMKAATKIILLVGGLGAMLLGVIWLIVLQFFAGCMVWLTCVLVLLVLLLMSLFCSVRSGIISADEVSSLSYLNSTTFSNVTSEASDSTSQTQFKVAAYLMWFLSGIVFLLLIAMHKRIKIAIAIIRESSKAIKKLPMLLLWPIVPTLFFIALVVYSVVIAAYLLSSDDLTSTIETTAASLSTAASTNVNATAVEALSGKQTQQVLLAYHVFGFLWTNQLIQAISITTIAGSIAQFYWTAPDEHGFRKLPARFPILRAIRYTLRFSIGSLCFGAFTIALVQFMRLCLEYLDHNTKQLQQNNRLVKVLFMSVRCCLWCFEKCLKFLSKNAYILIAMQGSSFCSASVQSFKILLSNLARVAVVNSISFFLLLLVKTTITLATGIVVFSLIANSSSLLGDAKVTSPMAPVLVSCVLAWLVASAFANVYDTAIDTILLCFCKDMEMHGQTASVFMSRELQRIMGGSIDSDSPKHKVVHVAHAANAHDSPKVHVEADI